LKFKYGWHIFYIEKNGNSIYFDIENQVFGIDNNHSFFIELEKEFSSYWNSSYLNKGSRSDDSHYDYSNSMYDTSIARIITSIVTLTIDAILTTRSNDPLKMSIGSILRPKMKWI
jgi:hypothetical protein